MTSQSRMMACLCAFVLGVGACTPERGGHMHNVQHISVYIDRRPAEVYEFAHRRAASYGILAVLLAVASGWAAGALFRRA